MLRRWCVAADSVVPLATPSAFYDALLERVTAARGRTTLASLYIGVGELEQRLCAAIAASQAQAVQEARALDVRVQLDYCRGTRHVGGGGYASSAALLSALKAPGTPGYLNTCAGFTLMPAQRGLAGRVLPPRFIEGAGVFHMKAYVVDNDVILSGANLSDDYFTTRQDRALLISNAPEFATHIHDLVRELQLLPGSHVLAPDGRIITIPVPGVTPLTARPSDDLLAACTGVHGLRILRARERSHDAQGDGLGVGVEQGVSARAAQPPGAAQCVSVPARATLPTAPASSASAHAPCVTPSSGLLTPPSQCPTVLPPRRLSRAENAAFVSALRRALDRASFAEDDVAPAPDTVNTAVLTLRTQCGRLGVRHDERATLRLLQHLRPAPEAAETAADAASAAASPRTAGRAASVGSELYADVTHLATGYFNLPPVYIRALVHEAHPASRIDLLSSAPKANGFFGASGLAGSVPQAYTEIARSFLHRVVSAQRAGAPCIPPTRTAPPHLDGSVLRVKAAGIDTHAYAPPGKRGGSPAGGGVTLWEYARPGWTFHGKGLWLQRWQRRRGQADAHSTASHEQAPLGTGWLLDSMVSYVGSPNFGRRSVANDVELNVELVTREPQLMDRLTAERDALFDFERQRRAALDASSARADSNSACTQSAAPATTAMPAAHVRPVTLDTWAQEPARRLRGWSWSHGWWIHVGRRILAPYL